MAGKNYGRADMYRAERDKGFTYQQIADKYGVSRQNIAQACGKFNPKRFQYHREKAVIFPALRKWMNDNRISNNELSRRLGFNSLNAERVKKLLNGKNDMKKETIDKLLVITGMTYEELFGGVEC